MRRAVYQWLLMGFALVWGASGCNCGEPPVESQLAVDFERPTDGQRLTLDDDADPATDGFQFDVAAVVRDTAGRPVTVASAKLELRTPTEQEWREGPPAVIDGATVRFPGTLLQTRTNLLQVTVEEAGSRRTANQRITVTVSTEPPSVELTQPSEGQVLREADDAEPDTAGYQLRFSVRSVGLAGKAGTLYCEKACGLPPTDFTVNSSGLTQVSVTLAQSACEAQEAACYAVVRNGDREVTSNTRNLKLDTVAPRVELVSPVAPVSSTTFRVEATVGCTEPGVTATLSRPGAPDLSAPVVGGGVTFPTVTVPVDGDYSFTLRVADEGGNVTTKQIPVTVASTAPTLRLVVPGTVTSDASTELPGVQAPVIVQANSTPVGTEVRLFTSVTGQFDQLARPQRAVTAAVGSNREASFMVNLATDRANTVQACVSNAAGQEQCAVETVTFSPGGSTCAITAPADGTFLVRPSSAESPKVRVNSGNGPVTVVAYDMNGQEVDRFIGDASASLAEVSITSLTDGEYRLVATCPGEGTSQLLSVGVDTTAPALSFNVHGLPAGQDTLGPEVNDTSLSPGMQISLDVTTEPRSAVLATGCGMTVGAAGTSDANGSLLLQEVSVPPRGTCDLQVRATDPAGNVTTQTRTLTLAFASGELRFVSPEAGRYLGPTDGVVGPSGGLTVSVRLEVEPTAAGTLRLLRGSTEIASIPVAATDTEKTFTGVVLEEGANVLRAELIGPSGTAACATVLLLVDTQPGNITLEVPASSPAVYKVSLDAVPARSGIQAALLYRVPNRSPTAVVDICTSQALAPGASPCRDGSGWFTLAANVPASVPDFTYPDGQYALKAVLDDGAISTSREISLTVDSVEPVVRTVELLGDANGDKRLNAEELPSGAPQLRVTVDGLEDGRSVQVRNATNTNIIYGQTSSSGGQATVPLTAMPTGIAADYSLVVTVTDAAGNPNRVSDPTPFYPLNTAAFFAFRLDRVAPSLVVSAPSRTAFGIADDASAAAGFQVRATVNTDADVSTDGVHMELSPAGGTVDLTPSGLVATHEFTLPATGTVAYTLTISAVDTSGNRSAPVVRTFTVDLEPPTADLVTPAANTVYTSTDLPVRVNVSGGDVSTVRILTQVGTGSPVVIGDLPVTAGVAQGTLNFPVGVQTVTAQASDPAGNMASDSEANVTVSQAGCVISLTTPSEPVVTLLAQDDRDPGTPGLQYQLVGNTLDCRGRTVSLYRGSSGTAEATTTADATTGDFSFDVTLADGEQTRLTVEVLNASSIRTVDFVDVTVDITPPVITSVSPSATTLYFVAETNAFLFPTPAPDRVVDQSAGGDANATFSLTVTQGAGSRVQAFYQGTPASAEFTVPGDPSTLDIPVTLTHDTTGTFELRVRDAAGNTALHTVSATVDVIPPAAPMVTRALVTGQERAARVDVTWTASGDDGLSGTPAGYDLRWTVNAQLQNGMQTEAQFFSPKVRQETGSLLPAATTSYRLTLPPLANYSIQLRPQDEIGNYPPFQASSLVPNFWTLKTLNNPGAASGAFGLYITSRGDLNADGFDDLVVAAPNGNPGLTYVYYGSSNPQIENRQDIALPAPGAQFDGADLDVGDVGNATASPVQDLVVGGRGFSGTSGRVLLYFGRAGTTVDTTAPIEIQHIPAIANASLGGAVKMIGDITGDGLQELAISSHGESTPKVYIFYGRSPDAWRALGTGCTASAPCVVPSSRADKIISAPAGTMFFGRNRGYVPLGDITGDGVQDFTIPSSHETQNRVYVFSGAAVRSMPGTAVSVTDAIQVLNQPRATTTNGTNGFGTEAVGGVNLAGEAGLDLVVGMASENKVFVYRDLNASGFASRLEIQGALRYGAALARGDLNQDGLPDIVIGQNAPASSVYVHYNKGILGDEFDAVQEDGFFRSKLESATNLGTSVSVLDFNGDGKPDLAAGDSTSNPARVVIYY